LPAPLCQNKHSNDVQMLQKKGAPFSVYGIKSDAISILDFIGVAAKLMP